MANHEGGAGKHVSPGANPQLPLLYVGGDLGLGDGEHPWIHFADQTGQQYLTHSVEWVLRNIDCFLEGRDRTQLLAAAALHYSLDTYALMGRHGYQDYLTDCVRHKPLTTAAVRYGLDTCPLTGRGNIQHYQRVW